MANRNATLLTNRVCNAAEKQTRRYHIWDSQLTGFGLRIEPSGTKSFIAKYRANGGGRRATQKVVTIGRLGILTPELARRQARKVLGAVAVGDDPAAELQAQRRQMKVSELIELYEKEGCFIQRGKRQGFPMKERTKKYMLARLRHHVLPLLGRRLVCDVAVGDVERFFRDVAEGQTVKRDELGPRRIVAVRGGEGAARRVFRDLSAMYSFAIRREILDRNPCEKAAVRKTDNQKTRFLTLVEVQRLGSAFDELAADGTNPKALDIMRLWALTGCRRDEIAGLKWTEIDFEHGCLRLAETKTGKSVRPLGSAAIAILRGITRTDDSDYVFPAETGEGFFRGYKTPWRLAIEKADLPGVSPHTLRHTMASTAISSGEALAFTGAILGHASLRSTMIYAHVQNEPARQVADRVSERIAAALRAASDIANDDPELPPSEDELLLAGVASLLKEDSDDANRMRALLKLFVKCETIPPPANSDGEEQDRLVA